MGNSFPITLGTVTFSSFHVIELQNFFQVTFDVVANTKGWRKKQVVEIVSDFRLGMKEIGSKVKHQYFHMTLEHCLALKYGQCCMEHCCLIAIALLLKKISSQPLLFFLLTFLFCYCCGFWLWVFFFTILPFSLSGDVYITKCPRALSLKNSLEKYKPWQPNTAKQSEDGGYKITNRPLLTLKQMWHEIVEFDLKKERVLKETIIFWDLMG